MMDDEEIKREPTAIDAVGRKERRIVRLVCVCGYGVNFPDIEIQDYENYPESLIERWDSELVRLQCRPMRFRGLPIDEADPVRIKKAMRDFYDEEPLFKVTGDLSWFDSNLPPGTVF